MSFKIFFWFGSFNLINEFEQAFNESNSKQLSSNSTRLQPYKDLLLFLYLYLSFIFYFIASLSISYSMLHVLNFLFIFIPLWMINNGYGKFE